MSKKKFILLIGVVVFLALSAATAFLTLARSTVSASGVKHTVHLAFTGEGTTGQAQGSVITGGLNEAVRAGGYFSGDLHLPEGTEIATGGKLDDGKLAITFYDALGTPVIRGAGKITKAGNFVGTFEVFDQDKAVGSGLWSAWPVAEPKEVITAAFVGSITSSSTSMSGTVVVNKKTLTGTFNQADGTIFSISAKIIKHSNYNIRIKFNKGAIIGYGKTIVNPVNSLDKGYTGSFTVTSTHAEGTWQAFTYKF